MPSHLHEALLQLFRNRPLLATELLQADRGAKLPRYTDARIVIGPASVAEIVDEVPVDPELAVLSAITHGQDKDFIKAARLAAAAQRASKRLDTERAGLYFSFIHNSLSEGARRALQDMSSTNPEFVIDPRQFPYEQGMYAGMDKGNHAALVKVVSNLLPQRFGELDDATRSRIASMDIDELEDIVGRLLLAETLNEALDPV